MAKISYILILFLLLTYPIYAGGLFVVCDSGKCTAHDVDQELCAINYFNRTELMLVTIDVSSLYGENAVWIFPVPARRDEIKLEMKETFPYFSDLTVSKAFEGQIISLYNDMAASQIYPLLFLLSSNRYMTRGIEDLYLINEDIILPIMKHEEIGTQGYTVEAIESYKLYGYLNDNNITLSSNLTRVINDYIREDYSFVIVRIPNIERLKENLTKDAYGRPINTIGVLVSFPTDKIYFPLKLLRIYGEQRIPIMIYVVNHVTPNIYPSIRSYTGVKYFEDSYYFPSNELSDFYDVTEDLKHTRIMIFAPSEQLTEDLWMENNAPTRIALMSFAIKNIVLWKLIIFILSSSLASLLAGMIVFGKDAIPKKKLALHGLWNFLTIVGFIIATLFLKTKKLEPEMEDKLKGYGIMIFDRRKVLFIVLFSLFFLIIISGFYVILKSIL